MKKQYLIIIISLSILSVGAICFAVTQSCHPLNGNSNRPDFYANSIASPYIPDQLTFAGEKVPIDIYWVREGLDKELMINCYQHSKTLQIFKRSGRFFPIIEKILKEENVPEDFKYLCVAESGLENVISPAKATGFWQFLESTGKSYGLEIGDDVDERYHIEKSTRAACRYLKSAKNKFGSWALAAAAYNMGEGGVSKNIANQNCDNYWDLYLNQETARYVYRILSYKLVFENPRFYGIYLCEADLYHPVPCKEVSINSSISDLYAFAKEKNIPYRELKNLNPWLRNNKLTVNAKNYTVQIPEKSKTTFIELYKDFVNPYVLIGDTIFHVK